MLQQQRLQFAFYVIEQVRTHAQFQPRCRNLVMERVKTEIVFLVDFSNGRSEPFCKAFISASSIDHWNLHRMTSSSAEQLSGEELNRF